MTDLVPGQIHILFNTETGLVNWFIILQASGGLKTRWCRVCKQDREERGFAPSEANGSYGKCKECTKWFKIKIRYGLTKDQYYELLSSQNGVCAICKDPERVKSSKTGILHVDHDHKTNKVRGLICNGCNSILGYADADNGPQLLESAIQYIKTRS